MEKSPKPNFLVILLIYPLIIPVHDDPQIFLTFFLEVHSVVSFKKLFFLNTFSSHAHITETETIILMII